MVHKTLIGLTQDIDDTFVHGLEQSQQVLDKQCKCSNGDLVAELVHVKLSVQINTINVSVRKRSAMQKTNNADPQTYFAADQSADLLLEGSDMVKQSLG